MYCVIGSTCSHSGRQVRTDGGGAATSTFSKLPWEGANEADSSHVPINIHFVIRVIYNFVRIDKRRTAHESM